MCFDLSEPDVCHSKLEQKAMGLVEQTIGRKLEKPVDPLLAMMKARQQAMTRPNKKCATSSPEEMALQSSMTVVENSEKMPKSAIGKPPIPPVPNKEMPPNMLADDEEETSPTNLPTPKSASGVDKKVAKHIAADASEWGDAPDNAVIKRMFKCKNHSLPMGSFRGIAKWAAKPAPLYKQTEPKSSSLPPPLF